MNKSLIAVLVAVALLTGCQSRTEVVPVVEKFDPATMLAQPPAAAMIDPVEPTPLRYGASNSENSEIMKNNNLNAANDRTKLRTLQQYVRNIFKPRK